MGFLRNPRGRRFWCGGPSLQAPIRTRRSFYDTVDGSEPGRNSTLCAGLVQITKATTVKALAFVDDMIPSPATTIDYVTMTPHPAVDLCCTIRATAGGGSCWRSMAPALPGNVSKQRCRLISDHHSNLMKPRSPSNWG